MLSKKKQGFAAFPPDKHKEASRRGGSVTGKPKGYATLSPEARSENASKASRVRWDRAKAKRLENEVS